MIRLTDSEFEFIVSFMKSKYGITLEKKRQLIESRMNNTLVEKGFKTYTEYFELIKKNNTDEISLLINKLTTNHTFFMREPQHFDFLRDIILPYHEKNNKSHDIRIWSAGCSSGEEAYSAIMVMNEYFKTQKLSWDYSILATDISAKVLTKAQNNVYTEEMLQNIPVEWKKRYFNSSGSDNYQLTSDVKKQVIFKTFNLMDPFHYKKPFDLIFCRNVMIYFDQPTKNALIEKFYDALNPGGYLFIGHSESVQREHSRFKYVKPSIYQKG